MSTTKQSGTRRSQPLPPAEALILLRSAIGYVLESGLKVGARNGDGGILITIAGAQVIHNNGAADFVPQSDVPHSIESVAQPLSE